MGLAIPITKIPAAVFGIFTMLISMIAATAVHGEDSQPWVKGNYARARLIPGSLTTDRGEKVMRAGIQIQLDEGWKTYWRNPGDSGLPASFDFAASENLKNAKVLWPAPHRFSDPYGTSIGYENEVVFPVLVSAERGNEPVDLDLQLEYAICKDICVPAKARLTLKLDPDEASSWGFDPVIVRYLKKVPDGAAGKNGGLPSIRKAKARLDGDVPQIVVEAHFPDGTEGADLFVEAPGTTYVPPPQQREVGDNGQVRFTIELQDQAGSDALKGKTLDLTLVSDSGQSQTSWTVD